MSVHALSWAFKQKTNTPTTKLVLVALANYADELNSCFPSHQHLSSRCEISERQVRRCIDDLCGLGLVKKETRAGTSNRYFLGVVTDVQGGVVTHVQGVRTPTSAYTKPIRKKKTGRSLNEIAG